MVAPVGDATLKPKFEKLLLLMLSVAVAVPVVDSTVIPCKVPDATPVVTDSALLLIALVKVPVGAAENEGT